MINIIAAIGKNRELGFNNKLLWHIPQDLKHFKQLTLGHPVIMGRKTFMSLGKPLPGRTNIVVTRSSVLNNTSGVLFAGSLEEAIEEAKKTDKEEIFVIGGGQVYNQALPLADRLYLTVIDETAPADTYFPDYSEFKKTISKEKGQSGSLNYEFLVLSR